MARPKREGGTTNVTLRLNDTEVAELDASAATMGVTRTAWLRQAIAAQLRRVAQGDRPSVPPAEDAPPARPSGPVERARYDVRSLEEVRRVNWAERPERVGGLEDVLRCPRCGAQTMAWKGGRYCKACGALTDRIREELEAW